MARTHQLGGVALWLGACAALPVPPVAVLAGVPVAAVTALWPDIDSEQSRVSRWLGPFSYWLALRVRRRFGHRYGVHSLLAGVAVCALLAGGLGLVAGLFAVLALDAASGVLWPLVAVCAGAGYVGAASHSLLDLPTYGCGRCAKHQPCAGEHANPGCALLWPLVRRRVGVAWILVGGSRELRVVRPLLSGLTVLAAVAVLMP